LDRRCVLNLAGSIGSRVKVVLMRNGSGWAAFSLGAFSLGAASTLALLVAALEVSVAAIPLVRGVDPASVNRTFKGDRTPALPGSSRVIPGQPISEPEPKLPDGCISEADWRGNIYSDEIAGRCLA
jgi:hypothetical protein